jgi:hypothetical protein
VNRESSMMKVRICALILFLIPSVAAGAVCRHDTATKLPITGVKGSLQNPCFIASSGGVLAFTNFTVR